MSSRARPANASRRVLRTTGGEALAFLAVLASIARANDDVIVVGEAPSWLATVCGLTRVRLRASTRDGAFDAIGEHTRALVIASDDEELIEALVELGPHVIAIAPHAAERTFTLRRDAEGVTLTLPDDTHAEAIERTLSTLAPSPRTLAP
ncbi:MAG: hypothetical protein J0L92_31645 [Deltaproteobacteria bacterium]|nr:hypothetical protein [Deltaproteobacteria bacterium]